MPVRSAVVSRPSMMKRFSEADEPSTIVPPPRASLALVPGALLMTDGEIAPLRDAIDDVRLDADRGGVALDVDERRFRRHLDRLGHAGDRQREIDLQRLPEVQLNVRDFLGVEALQRGADFINAGGQRREAVDAVSVRRGRLHADETWAPRFNRRARQHRAGPSFTTPSIEPRVSCAHAPVAIDRHTARTPNKQA